MGRGLRKVGIVVGGLQGARPQVLTRYPWNFSQGTSSAFNGYPPWSAPNATGWVISYSLPQGALPLPPCAGR